MDDDSVDTEDASEWACVLTTGTTKGCKILWIEQSSQLFREYNQGRIEYEHTWFFREYPLPSLSDLIGLAILSFATAKNLYM